MQERKQEDSNNNIKRIYWNLKLVADHKNYLFIF